MAAAKKPMTKTQIVNHFAEKFGFSKKTAAEVVDEFSNLAQSQVKKAGAFTMPGIGKIAIQNRKARKGRNPATGEEIKIPAKRVVKARLAKSFQESIVPSKKK
ncbi:HU family DNA-binding protein [bacterium]|nr:HU family DNA-binding protein [bacterium]